jgi:Protein of unknown function (DUF1554)
MRRAFVVGITVGLFFSLTWSCGRECTAANCSGCCTVLGQCARGLTVDSCGSNGQACSACANGPCSDGVCTGGQASGGGVVGGTVGGGSANSGGGGGGVAADNRSRVFVTSLEYTGKLGGLTGADALCQNAATAANKGGTWKAFLGAGSDTAASRMVEAGPWFQETKNGQFILTYNNKSNLTTTALATISIDERGTNLFQNSASYPQYWTGMTAAGVLGSTCTGWTVEGSASGLVAKNGVAQVNASSCYETNALLCFEQSKEPRAVALPTTRKRLFVTSVEYSGKLGGLAGADAFCQNAATAANKGGTWKAFLGAGVETAVSRMAEAGPWYQQTKTGTFILTYNNKANLTTNALANISIDEQGNDRFATSASYPTYWAGMTSANQVGVTCSGWTSEGSGGGLVAKNSSPQVTPASCYETNPLLCFEQ